jgi:hypothetical protein
MTIAAVGSAAHQIQPQQVSAAALKAANGDGDGRTGVAALNDGDAAATRAAQQVAPSAHAVDTMA